MQAHRNTDRDRHSACCGCRESHCVATDGCQGTHSTAQRCWNRRPKSIHSTPVCGQIRPLGLRATTITPTREEDHRHRFCVKLILPGQLVDTDKQTNKHTPHKTIIHVRPQKETRSYGKVTTAKYKKNDSHGIVSTELTGCSKRTHPANPVGDTAPL